MAEPMTIYHPWRVLRDEWPHVRVEHTDELQAGRRADTNGVDEIRIRDRLYQVERRCSLTHELIHLERGDRGACTPPIETWVNREASRRLIPWECLLDAVRWARSERELADELWVTLPILRARAETLHADDLMALARATWAPE